MIEPLGQRGGVAPAHGAAQLVEASGGIQESADDVKDPLLLEEVDGLIRRDWKLTWNQVLEAGALLVGEEVRLTLDVQAVALEPAAA